MEIITAIAKRFRLKQKNPILGRWRVNDVDAARERRATLANIDSCGDTECCGNPMSLIGTVYNPATPQQTALSKSLQDVETINAKKINVYLHRQRMWPDNNDPNFRA